MSASLWRQLQEKACSGSKTLMKNGKDFYWKTLEKNKQYIEKEPTVEKCIELSNKLFYTRFASLPYRYEKFWEEIDVVKKKAMNRKDLKIEDVGIATLFSLECVAWFYLGKLIAER